MRFFFINVKHFLEIFDINDIYFSQEREKKRKGEYEKYNKAQ